MARKHAGPRTNNDTTTRATVQVSSAAARPRRRALTDAAVAACIFAARVAAADDSAGPAANAGASGGGGVAEVTVTANRREQNIQDVPIAIQALTGATLQQLSIENFEDAVKYLPNVTVAGGGRSGTIKRTHRISACDGAAHHIDSQSVRVARQHAGRVATVSGQSACPVRVYVGGLPAFRTGRRPAPGPFPFSHGLCAELRSTGLYDV
jgi:hypothetical protein